MAGRRKAVAGLMAPVGRALGLAVTLTVALGPGCSRDEPDPHDAALPADSGVVLDTGVIDRDAAPGPTDAGGGSTVGMICANDDNCTGEGEICCLESDPFVCRLVADCEATSGGIPCEGEADCPSSRVCCRLPTDQFCTTRRACAGFGGDEVP